MTARLSDLFIDPRTNKLSTTKLWMNIGNAAMVAAFLRHSWLHPLDAELLFAFGAIVVGNNIATRFLKGKYAPRDPE